MDGAGRGILRRCDVIRFVTETGSTNSDLAAQVRAAEVVAEGHWLVADRQVAGRGRQGRSWFDGSGNFKEKLQEFIDKFGVSTEDVKNLTTAKLLNKLADSVGGEDKTIISSLMGTVKNLGIGGQTLDQLLNK